MALNYEKSLKQNNKHCLPLCVHAPACMCFCIYAICLCFLKQVFIAIADLPIKLGWLPASSPKSTFLGTLTSPYVTF